MGSPNKSLISTARHGWNLIQHKRLVVLGASAIIAGAAQAATTWTEEAARVDLISHIQAAPANPHYGIRATAQGTPPPANSMGMDTAKVIQVGPRYYAVYSPGSKSVKLASSSNPDGPWTEIAMLDDDHASQPYLAQGPSGSFVLADEYDTGLSQSAIKFKHYASLAELTSGKSDKEYQTTLTLSGCHEGTPDIHGISSDGSRIDVGLHYNSDCLLKQLDREGFGTLTNFNMWEATADSVRDDALTNAGFPGKHGGRDDIMWHGYRFSLQEANTSEDFKWENWGLALYDYSNHTAYQVHLNIPPTCATNPRITLVSDSAGKSELVIAAFIPKECAVGAPQRSGELIYVMPAQ